VSRIDLSKNPILRLAHDRFDRIALEEDDEQEKEERLLICQMKDFENS